MPIEECVLITILSLSVRCNAVGKCNDEAISEFTSNGIQICMSKCTEQRACVFSSFSEKEKLCSLHEKCDDIDKSKDLYLSSKWSCEIPTCKNNFSQVKQWVRNLSFLIMKTALKEPEGTWMIGKLKQRIDQNW